MDYLTIVIVAAIVTTGLAVGLVIILRLPAYGDLVERVKQLEVDAAGNLGKLSRIEERLTAVVRIASKLRDGIIVLSQQIHDLDARPVWTIPEDVNEWFESYVTDEGPYDETEPVEVALLLGMHFNLNEIDDLCMRLGVEAENLPGTTLAARARNLVGYFQRRGQLHVLVKQCEELRPKVYWPNV